MHILQSEPPKQLMNSNDVTLSSRQQVQQGHILGPETLSSVLILKLPRGFRYTWSGFAAGVLASVRVKVRTVQETNKVSASYSHYSPLQQCLALTMLSQ